MVSYYMELALIPVEIGLELLVSIILYMELVSVLGCGLSWKHGKLVPLYGIRPVVDNRIRKLEGESDSFSCLLLSDLVFYSDSCGLVNKYNPFASFDLFLEVNYND